MKYNTAEHERGGDIPCGSSSESLGVCVSLVSSEKRGKFLAPS